MSGSRRVASRAASGVWPAWARPGVILAALILLAVVLCLIAPGVITPHDPDAVDPVHTLRPPDGAHLFGTDQLGRDLFSRVVYSARFSVLVALGAVVSSSIVGAVVGLLAGFAGGWIDAVLMRAVDVLLAFPALLLALAVVGVLGSSMLNVTIAVGIAILAPFCRVTRAQVLHVRAQPYIDAAAVGGVSPVAIVFRHVIPNAAGPVLLVSLMGTGVAMLASSSLSFLGFGPTPPATDWGTLAAAGRDYVGSAWWLTTFPGAAVLVTVLSLMALHRAWTRR